MPLKLVKNIITLSLFILVSDQTVLSWISSSMQDGDKDFAFIALLYTSFSFSSYFYTLCQAKHAKLRLYNELNTVKRVKGVSRKTMKWNISGIWCQPSPKINLFTKWKYWLIRYQNKTCQLSIGKAFLTLNFFVFEPITVAYIIVVTYNTISYAVWLYYRRTSGVVTYLTQIILPLSGAYNSFVIRLWLALGMWNCLVISLAS